MFVAVAAISFASCGNKAQAPVEEVVDSIAEVADSVVDSLVDSTAAAVDSVAAAVAE